MDNIKKSDSSNNSAGLPDKLDNSPEQNEKLCKGCTKCCEYVTIEVETPKDKEDLEEMRWWLLHGVHVFIDKEDGWMALVPNKCQKLGSDGMCTIYDTRPIVCRKYSQSECEKYGDPDYFYEFFTNEGDFVDYIQRTPEFKKIFDQE